MVPGSKPACCRLEPCEGPVHPEQPPERSNHAGTDVLGSATLWVLNSARYCWDAVTESTKRFSAAFVCAVLQQ